MVLMAHGFGAGHDFVCKMCQLVIPNIVWPVVLSIQVAVDNQLNKT